MITVPVTLERLDIHSILGSGALQASSASHRGNHRPDAATGVLGQGRDRPSRLAPVRGCSWTADTGAALGDSGIKKSINLGVRRGEQTTSYIDGFLKLAMEMGR
nr:hypothetical protein [Mesorhizobium sp.]